MSCLVSEKTIKSGNSSSGWRRRRRSFSLHVRERMGNEGQIIKENLLFPRLMMTFKRSRVEIGLKLRCKSIPSA